MSSRRAWPPAPATSSRWEEQAARHQAKVKGYEEVIARRDDILAGILAVRRG